jgi:hypothetical protein
VILALVVASAVASLPAIAGHGSTGDRVHGKSVQAADDDKC